MEQYQEYRDSGVEWIGEIPSHWNKKRMRFLYNFRSGMGNKKPEDFGEGFPFLAYKDVYSNDSVKSISGLVKSTPEDQERYSIRRGDAFFTGSSETIDELGFSSVALKDIPLATFNGFTIRARPTDESLQPEYARYLLRSDVVRGYLTQRDNSITRANLSQQTLGDLVVLIPPLYEQQKIAKYLEQKTSEIDSLIKETEKSIELLEEYRKSVISEAVTKGLDSDAPMKDSGIEWIGKIPGHWDICKITNLADRRSGHTPDKTKAEYWEDGDIVWISLADSPELRTHRYISDSVSKTNQLGIDNSSAELLPKGSVLLSRDATVGLCAIAGCDLAVSQHFMAYICGPRLLNEYLLDAFYAMDQELKKLSMGSTIPTIGLPLIKGLKIPVPPLEEQHQIASYITNKLDSIDEVVSQKRREADALGRFRKSIISEAVTGKFRVPGVE